jgi:hypothetical protein
MHSHRHFLATRIDSSDLQLKLQRSAITGIMTQTRSADE